MQSGAGCDMLVVQPPLTPHGCKFFGKNADLPREDFQNFTQHPSEDYPKGANVKCTFISIPQVSHTFAWVGSQAVWQRGCWGVEMGMNEHSVSVASVALGSKLRDLADRTERLFDVDINRLALERSKSASEAVNIITQMTTEHGQGGIMSENDTIGESYDGAYLVVDSDETWLIETTEFYYAARRVTEPWFSMANHMTITTNYDRISPDIEQVCVSKGLWDVRSGKFDWFAAVGQINNSWLTTERKCGGEKFMNDKLKECGIIHFRDAADFFRGKESGICRKFDLKEPVCSISTMLCVYPASSACTQPLLTFTCTADPSKSMFKPFMWSMDKLPDDLLQSQTSKNGTILPSKLYQLHRSKVLENEDKNKSALMVQKTRALESEFMHSYMLAVAGEHMPLHHEQWLCKYTQAEIDIYSN